MLGRGGPPLSHLFFADDLILFGEANLQTAEAMNKVLVELCNQSGRKVSLSKSMPCFSSNID